MEIYPIMLQLAICGPIAAAIVLLLGSRLGEKAVRGTALAGFGLPLLSAVWLCFAFPHVETGQLIDGYAFVMRIDTGLLEPFGISLMLGLNGISMPLFALAAVVGFAAGLQAVFSGAARLHIYCALLLIMQAGLMGVFASIDLFFFYFFHELALIPTFIMIGLWGGLGRRVAAMEMTVYLTLGAMLSLLGLLWIYASTGWDAGVGFNMIHLREYIALNPISKVLQENGFGLLLFGFGILVSLFPFHSWAPRGYAAAPTAAAMLHAGILKKFGLYGLVQIAAPILPLGLIHWNPVLVWLALGNIILIGFVTMAQTDLKRMIGYSSVMHMGYIFLGIATFSVIGLGGAVLLMVAHGLSVALLFLLANFIQQRTGTTDMEKMGGLGPHTPVLAAFFVAATMASIGLPGFANFWGEFAIFIALWQDHAWALVPAAFGIVISAVYGLRAVARVFFGPPCADFAQHVERSAPTDLSLRERLPALVLLLALFAVGLWPKMLSQSVNAELSARHEPAAVVITASSAASETPVDHNLELHR